MKHNQASINIFLLHIFVLLTDNKKVIKFSTKFSKFKKLISYMMNWATYIYSPCNSHLLSKYL